MPKKSTTEEFIKKAREKHGDTYDYSLVEYVNNSTKVKIKCKKKEHGEFLQRPNDHLTGYGCMMCGRQTSKEKQTKHPLDFIAQSEKIHKDMNDIPLYDYSQVDYVNSLIKVKIKCKKCDKYFEMKPCDHLSGQGCRVCGNRRQGEKRKSNNDDFIEKAKEKHKDEKGIPKYCYLQVKYTGQLTAVKIFCIKCEKYFYQTPHIHLTGHGCQECGRQTTKEKQTKHHLDFIAQSEKIHKDMNDIPLYDYSQVDYVNSLIKVKIKCKKCDKYFEQCPGSHLSGRGCPKCNNIIQTSKPAQQWIDYLSVSLPEIQHFYSEYGEFTIPNSRYKADGYDEETNTIYEFHGDFWHGNPQIYDQNAINNVTKTTFGELYEKTLSKEEYCKSQGYNYISLWENDWNKGVNALRKIQRKFKEFYTS